MWPLLINGFRAFGTAAIGYFANDVTRLVGGWLPASAQSKVQDSKSSNGFAWWFTAIVLFILGVILVFIFKMISGKGKKGSLFMWVFGAAVTALMVSFGNSDDGYSLATALITLTTGAAVVSSSNLQFLPERISYAAATQLQNVKVTVQGDGVVFDSDANGLTHIGVSRVIGQVTNNYILTLANGLIKNKNVLFEFTNSAAQTPIVFYDSDSNPPPEQGDTFLQMMKVPILVGGNDFDDFATLSFPSMAATDSVTILYKDGTVQANMNRIDLQYRVGYVQNVVNTPIYTIDNYGKQIKAVTFNAVAAQTAYMQRWNKSLSDRMISGQA
jgi:hypothetical protein